MGKPIIIFGVGELAQLAHHYFSNDTDYEVAGFTVDRDYMTESRFLGLPVFPFETIADQCPPDRFFMFIALGYSGLNVLRKAKYVKARELGYQMASYVSPRATILNDGKIGDNAFILENNTVQPFAVIGNNVTLWSGNHIGHHSIIRDHTFIASHAVISGGVEIGESCFIGVNATIRDHIKIGDRCIIGAGGLVMEDAEPESVYISEPTRLAAMNSSHIKSI